MADNTYIIELITKESPYISVGYWDGESVSRNIINAKRIEAKDVKAICKSLREKYNGKRCSYLMPWVYDMYGNRHMELER